MEKSSKINVFRGRGHGVKSQKLNTERTKGTDTQISAPFSFISLNRLKPYGVFSYHHVLQKLCQKGLKITYFFVCERRRKIGMDVFPCENVKTNTRRLFTENQHFKICGYPDHLDLNGKIQSWFFLSWENLFRKIPPN